MQSDADNVMRLDFLEWGQKDVTHYQKKQTKKKKQLSKWAQQSEFMIVFE